MASFRKFFTWNRSNGEWPKARTRRDFPNWPIVCVLFCVWPAVHSLHPDKCSHALEGNSGVFTTPNYPHPYPNNIDCHWLIHVAVGEQIQLHFHVFSLEEKPNTDYVKVFDGSNQTDVLLGEFYGYTGVKVKLQSSGNRMYVTMHSDTHNAEKGFLATFQKKGFCLSDQLPCGWGEKDCFSKNLERCNGVWQCRENGGDERGCGQCAKTLFSCGDGKQCFERFDRCNGIGQCHNSKDEMGCSADMCNMNNGTFLCHNKKCIYEKWLCDGANDCGDNSDEVGCSVVTRRVILSSVVAALLCGLLIVVIFGCMCRLRMMHSFHRQHRWRRLDDTLSPAPPPPYSEALMTSHPVEEAEQEVLDELQAIATRRQGRMHGQSNAITDETSNQVDDDEQLINAGNNTDNEVERSSGVHIAMATGGTPLVYWRQESMQEPVVQPLPDDDESYDDSDVDKMMSDVSEISDETPSVTSGDISSSQHSVIKLSEVS